MKQVVPFARARETSLYGSKAVGLGEAARHGLAVPPGVADGARFSFSVSPARGPRTRVDVRVAVLV